VELILTLERIREVAAQKKESLQSEANQAIRKKDLEQGMGALAGIQAIDDFIYQLELAAGQPYRNPADWNGSKARRVNLRVMRRVRKRVRPVTSWKFLSESVTRKCPIIRVCRFRKFFRFKPIRSGIFSGCSLNSMN
jgi:hypothetical protein